MAQIDSAGKHQRKAHEKKKWRFGLMPVKDPMLDLVKLYYSADDGKTFQPFDEIKTVEITEKIIDCRDKNDLLPSCWPTVPLSLSGYVQMTKQQRKKLRRSWKRLINRINRDRCRVKRYKEAMRRLNLKMGNENELSQEMDDLLDMISQIDDEALYDEAKYKIQELYIS